MNPHKTILLAVVLLAITAPLARAQGTYMQFDPPGSVYTYGQGINTAGDIVVFSPRKRVLASGDMISGFLPNMNDGFPREWPGTITSVESLAVNARIPDNIE